MNVFMELGGISISGCDDWRSRSWRLEVGFWKKCEQLAEAGAGKWHGKPEIEDFEFSKASILFFPVQTQSKRSTTRNENNWASVQVKNGTSTPCPMNAEA